MFDTKMRIYYSYYAAFGMCLYCDQQNNHYSVLP
jgi:hypothetical protein